MTIYYPADVLVNGGYPATGCPKLPDGNLFDPTDNATLAFTFDGQKFKIVDCSSGEDLVLAEFPASQYHQAIGYLTTWAHETYIAECKIVRPQQHELPDVPANRPGEEHA